MGSFMENFAVMSAFVLGLFGSIFSLIQFFYQRIKDKAQAERDKEQAKKQDLKDRLYFLAQLIVDRDIPRESRQIFFDEYIAKGGNGSFVKWWLEGE